MCNDGGVGDELWAPTLEGRRRNVRSALTGAVRDGRLHTLDALIASDVVGAVLASDDCATLFRTLFLLACSRAHLNVAQHLYALYTTRDDVFGPVARVALRPTFTYARAVARRNGERDARLRAVAQWLDTVVDAERVALRGA